MVASNGAMKVAVAGDPGAIGYISRIRVLDLHGRTTALPGAPLAPWWPTWRTADLVAALSQKPDYILPSLSPLGLGGGAPSVVAREFISKADLESYTAAWCDPISFTYRGHEVISMPPSSSGGATMAEMANILEGYDLPSMPWHGPEMVHLYAEAWKRAYLQQLGGRSYQEVLQSLPRSEGIQFEVRWAA